MLSPFVRKNAENIGTTNRGSLSKTIASNLNGNSNPGTSSFGKADLQKSGDEEVSTDEYDGGLNGYNQDVEAGDNEDDFADDVEDNFTGYDDEGVRWVDGIRHDSPEIKVDDSELDDEYAGDLVEDEHAGYDGMSPIAFGSGQEDAEEESGAVSQAGTWQQTAKDQIGSRSVSLSQQANKYSPAKAYSQPSLAGASQTSISIPLPLAPSLSGAVVETKRGRFRARAGPKAVPAEVAEAIAMMDQQILEEDGEPPRKRPRGRPKGSKTGKKLATADKSGSGTPADGSATEPKKRGRPRKAPELSMKQIFLSSNAKFVPFRCQWHDPGTEGRPGGQCKAELMDIMTLGRHLLRNNHLVRGCYQPGVYTCHWDGCSQDPPSFKKYAEGLKHLQEHVEYLSWHMGDGYHNYGGPVGEWPLEPCNHPRDPLHHVFFKDKDEDQIFDPRLMDDQEPETAAGLLRRRRQMETNMIRAEENEAMDIKFKQYLWEKERCQRLGANKTVMKNKKRKRGI